jgi:predicted dehydrogenase
MAIDLTPEQRKVGEQNFQKAVDKLGLSRRDFLKGSLVAAGAVGGSAAAVYFGYKTVSGRPVRAALIGAGDEGGVLVGAHNPDFLKFVAVCDIRPTNMLRIFEGEPTGPRLGFKRIYGYGVEREGHSDYIQKFTDPEDLYKRLRDPDDIEAVVIALPLHLHAPVAVKVMKIGQERKKPIHVLTEKLMAWNIKQCKQMIKTAKETGSILSVGHQRHYSMVYAHAQEVVKAGLLGDVKHIRALWHRNFSWPYKHDDKKGEQVADGVITQPALRDGWYPPVLQKDYDELKDRVKEYGYKDVEQLVRWRLYPETGGGLMAELGSHQLDACSIFLGKVHPLAVQGYGGKLFFTRRKNDRAIDDHVFVTYEFPGPNHPKGARHGNDKNDVVVVTYSSVSTNSFEQYGECLMGSRGTMIVEAEQRVLLFAEKDPTAKGDQRTMEIKVETLAKGQSADVSGGSETLSSGPVPTGSARASAGGPPSRGYREEMEDFAYCVRLWDPGVGYKKDKDGNYRQRLPHCHGEVAMADAIVALTANQAMDARERIEFEKDWFDPDKLDAVPDDPDAKPQVEVKP